MYKTKYRFYKRSFLNLPREHEGAYVIAYVTETSKDQCLYPDGGRITISDCNRLVKLDFPLDDASDQKNSIRKANLLIDTFTKFRDELLNEIDHVENVRKAKKS